MGLPKFLKVHKKDTSSNTTGMSPLPPQKPSAGIPNMPPLDSTRGISAGEIPPPPRPGLEEQFPDAPPMPEEDINSPLEVPPVPDRLSGMPSELPEQPPEGIMPQPPIPIKEPKEELTPESPSLSEDLMLDMPSMDQESPMRMPPMPPGKDSDVTQEPQVPELPVSEQDEDFAAESLLDSEKNLEPEIPEMPQMDEDLSFPPPPEEETSIDSLDEEAKATDWTSEEPEISQSEPVIPAEEMEETVEEPAKEEPQEEFISEPVAQEPVKERLHAREEIPKAIHTEKGEHFVNGKQYNVLFDSVKDMRTGIGTLEKSLHQYTAVIDDQEKQYEKIATTLHNVQEMLMKIDSKIFEGR